MTVAAQFAGVFCSLIKKQLVSAVAQSRKHFNSLSLALFNSPRAHAVNMFTVIF